MFNILVSLIKHKIRPMFELSESFRFLLYCEYSSHPWI